MPDAAKLAALGDVLGKALPEVAHNAYTSYGPTVSTVEQEYTWHPLVGSVLRQVTHDLDVGGRTQLLVGWLGWLGKRRDAAVAALKLAGVSSDLPAKLDPKPTWLPTGPWSKPHFVDPSLWLVVGRHNTLEQEPDGTDQAVAGLTDPAGTAAAAAADPAVTTELLQQIRNLAEVYARWEAAAIIAAKLAGSQLTRPALTPPELVARVLALHRAEGALTVLPESDTLDASRYPVPLPPGRTQFTPQLNPNFYTYCASYLTDPVKYAHYVAIKKAASEPVADADSSFALTMAGMDIMWNTKFQPEVEACYPTTPPYDDSVKPTKNAFDWMALNREQASHQSHSDAVDEVTEELVIRQKMLDLTGITTDISGTVNRVVAVGADDYSHIPADPDGQVAWALKASGAAVGYLLLLLNQAAWYLDRLAYGPTRFGPTAPTRLPESIVYLLYHVGSEAPAMLSSAMLAATGPDASSPAAHALSSALHAHGYTGAVARAARKVIAVHKRTSSKFDKLSTGQLQTLATYWPTIAPVLGHAAVLPVLADYITAATPTEWKSWTEPRQNILGYRRMYEFLQRQVAP